MTEFWDDVRNAVDPERMEEVEKTIGTNARLIVHEIFLSLVAAHSPRKNENLEKTVRNTIHKAVQAALNIAAETKKDDLEQFYEIEGEVLINTSKMRRSFERYPRTGRRHIVNKLHRLQEVGWVPTPDEL